MGSYQLMAFFIWQFKVNCNTKYHAEIKIGQNAIIGKWRNWEIGKFEEDSNAYILLLQFPNFPPARAGPKLF
jgi:hypothetical protein